MASTMWRILRSHPFLLLGFLTYTMFLTVEALPREAHDAVMPLARVIIIPMYVGWLVVTIVSVQVLGTDSSTAAWRVARLLALVAGFVPYLLADALLRWRRSLHTTPAA